MKATPKVVIFTTPTCSFCNAAKRHLREKKVPFKEVDVSRDMAAFRDMQRRTGGNTGVPVILINNRPIIGFDKQQIDKLLNIK
ncbi:NrdH-redoxin [Bacteroidetes/Chlorobi group bacterium MS-B_bin-24]|jgi:glutaredoxin-like YruB-family protein|nr:MAG: NrdH-redoxin [Bacteroidetes/Chlorobi group bacterium MS-B_bin-24]